MQRLGSGLVMLLTAACATTPAPRGSSLVEACREDASSDPRCVSVLTAPSDGYEARAEVVAAEQQREAGQFRSRLERMRAAHEARVAARIRTATATTATIPGGPKADPDDGEDPLAAALDAVTREDEIQSGSSVRAMTKAPPPPAPTVVLPTPPPARVSTPAFGPTPEQWLRAARCLLEPDAKGLKEMVGELHAKGAPSRRAAGTAAVLLLDVEALDTRLTAELVHRRLAKSGPLCSSSGLKEPIRSLRAELGKAPGDAEALDRYRRGLERLDRTLQIRAGLPRSQ